MSELGVTPELQNQLPQSTSETTEAPFRFTLAKRIAIWTVCASVAELVAKSDLPFGNQAASSQFVGSKS